MARTGTGKAFLPWLIVFGLWAALHGTLAATVSSPVFQGQLPGPDEYMRLVRIAELRDGEGWYDSVIDRSNAPYGDTLHWTRPLDVLILAIALPLSIVTSPHNALFAAGAIVSPLLALIACGAIAWAVLPVVGRDRAVFAAILLLFQPAVAAYSAAGKADHHSLLFVLFALIVGGAIRMIAIRPKTSTAVTAGAVYALAIWTSVEMILLVALCQAAAVISWIRFPTVSARPHVVAALSFLAAMLLALIAEQPPESLLAVEFDRISIPFVAIAALTLAVWATALMQERFLPQPVAPRARLLAMTAAGVTAGAVLLALFPGLIGGPLAGADPRLNALWHMHISENQPLFPTALDRTGRFLFFIGTAAAALPYAVFIGWRNRTGPQGMTWIFLGAVPAVYFLLALFRIRFSPFAEIAAAPLLADMFVRLVDWSGRRLDLPRRVLVNCSAGFALMFGSALAGAYLQTLSAAKASGREAEPKCAISGIAPVLNNPEGLGARPLIVAALLDRGPELLYRTGHSVVSSPYHRNGSGIWDTYRLFASPDEAESRAIVTRRGIDLLLLCPSRSERRFFTHETAAGGLYDSLLDGKIPDWLTPVPLLPGGNSDFRLFRIRS